MKKISFLLLLVIALYSSALKAQTSQNLYGLGFHVGTLEYNGDLGNAFYKFNDPQLLGAVSFAKYMSPSWDIEALLAAGKLGYTPDRKPNQFRGTLVDFNLYAKFKFNNGKILKEDARIAPYLFLGIGDAYYKSSYTSYVKLVPKGYGVDFNFPFGAGLNVRINDNAALKVQSTFHYSNTDKYDGTTTSTTNFNDGYLFNTIGLVFNIGKKDSDKDGIADKKDKCPATPLKVLVDVNGCPLDKDMDGIADYLDKCPEIKGMATAEGCVDADADSVRDDQDACLNIYGPVKFRGCPDSDGDGLPDVYDKCPKMAGSKELNGCVDADNDGVMDDVDACPNEKGSAVNQGCADSDGDGVLDKNDKCAQIAGTAANFGCPEIKEETKKIFEQALRGIQFETGKDIIKKQSYGILDNVVVVMKENSSYKLSIAGHTDNQGDDAKNMTLSQNRANAVKKYLTDKGVDGSKLTPIGFGETKPVDSNETKEGRAKNRRVEFTVQF
jgi:outer membrane protein OmpA-like peptidoglycan-associated protein